MSDLLSKPLTRESVDRALSALEARIVRINTSLHQQPDSPMNERIREGLEKDKAALLEIRASIE